MVYNSSTIESYYKYWLLNLFEFIKNFLKTKKKIKKRKLINFKLKVYKRMLNYYHWTFFLRRTLDQLNRRRICNNKLWTDCWYNWNWIPKADNHVVYVFLIDLCILTLYQYFCLHFVMHSKWGRNQNLIRHDLLLK